MAMQLNQSTATAKLSELHQMPVSNSSKLQKDTLIIPHRNMFNMVTKN